MASFLCDIAMGDGSLPFIGDWDGAKVWVTDHHRPVELYKLGRSSPTSIAYPDAGYYILKGKPFLVIFDCGPIGMGGKRLATHGHSDLLNFCLAVEGEPFIIDPGSGTYTEDKKIHDYFRSTSGHNTITIDGKDQCGLAGTWTLEKHPNAKLLFWETSENVDRVCGEHDGYKPIIHRREIQLIKKPVPVVKVYDHILGEGFHRYQCYLHLSPKITPQINNMEIKLRSLKQTLIIHFNPELSVRVAYGLFAPDYGRWIKSPVLILEGSSQLPAKITWDFFK
jgi:uncharacterized heparinase superfamily protein